MPGLNFDAKTFRRGMTSAKNTSAAAERKRGSATAGDAMNSADDGIKGQDVRQRKLKGKTRPQDPADGQRRFRQVDANAGGK